MDELEQSGIPMTRSLMLEFDDIDNDIDDQFMLGSQIMMAPILERGADSRDVFFPVGKWEHYFTGEQIEIQDVSILHVDCPIGQPAVYKKID
jgi:alpha-glucosidase (family GH31 glycosyl hydrolase)